MSTAPAPIPIAGVQMNVAIGQLDENFRRMAHFLRQTAAAGARLTIFPECALPGYCFASLEEARPYAEPVPGPHTEQMAALCRELDCWAIFGLLEADGPRLFNAAALVGPTGVVQVYRKLHLPFLGVDMFTTPGEGPLAVADAAGLRLGMNICYDAAFPEASRVLMLLGADLIVLPTNWPPGAECTAQFVIPARAMENHLYFAAINRAGEERGFRFIGQSKICDPSGRILAAAAGEGEEVLYAAIDPALARRKRVIRVPGKHEIDRLKDRRPDCYGPLVEPKRD